MLDLFPFDLVERGSTILLYGLGRCGCTYFEQNNQLRWCNIKYVSDKARPLKEFQDFYVKPEDISKVVEKVDKIVIAISHSAIVKQVREQMINNGINESIIVSAVPEEKLALTDFPRKDAVKRKGRKILLIMGGGLGDCIVFLSVYQRLMDYLPDAEYVIQGKTSQPDTESVIQRGMALLNVVYGQKTNVTIIPQNLDIKDPDEFECILELNHYIKVIWCNQVFLPETLIKKLEAYEAEYEGKYNTREMREAVYIRRMIIAGRNRYSALGGGNIFDLEAVKLKIDFTEQARDIYNQYNLKQYITFNYGAAKLRTTAREQLKVWPKEYYVEWIDRFKEKYPDVEVIQIGEKDATIIDGADRYLLGEQFEVVKYILQNAVFHFDCEGGLVHLATAIGTKCIVLFGPTPIEYYAYPQNVNLCTGVCKGCIDLIDNWYYECINNNKQCCMYSITPEMVMEKINDIVEK